MDMVGRFMVGLDAGGGAEDAAGARGAVNDGVNDGVLCGAACAVAPRILALMWYVTIDPIKSRAKCAMGLMPVPFLHHLR